MRDAQIYIIHPGTRILYSLPEMAQKTGLASSVIHGRIRRGDTGWQLWRPTGTRARDYDPVDLDTVYKPILCNETEEIIF